MAVKFFEVTSSGGKQCTLSYVFACWASWQKFSVLREITVYSKHLAEPANIRPRALKVTSMHSLHSRVDAINNALREGRLSPRPS